MNTGQRDFAYVGGRHHAGTGGLIELFRIPFDLHQKYPI